MTEKVNELKKKEEKKSFLQRTWDKMKKPLAAGVLTAGLLMHPTPGKAVGFEYARDPPYYASQILEKEYPEGWKLVMKGDQEREALYFDAAIKYFKKAYEKDKKPESLYMWAWCVYYRGNGELTFEATEKMEKEAIELIEERLEKVPIDLDFIDLKLMIYYNLAIMYGRAATGQITRPSEIHAYDPSKRDFYTKKAREYANKYLEYWNRVEKEWDNLQYLLFDLKSLYTDKEIKEAKESHKIGHIKCQNEMTELLNRINK